MNRNENGNNARGGPQASASPFPTGHDFLSVIADRESACERRTLDQIPQLGEKLPQCHQAIADALTILYQEASCARGCSGGDHIPQRIAARIVSHALAALKLLLRGYYDESLSLTRSIGETANLLWLFALVPGHYETWKSADERARWKAYKPARVRELLSGAQIPIPIDRDRYSLLSTVTVHIGPEVSPQSHAPQARATLGAIYRDDSVMAALNELAGALGTATASLCPLLPQRCREELKAAALAVLDSVGGMTLAEVRKGAWLKRSAPLDPV